MAENKVKFGLKNLHYAVRANGAAGTVKAVDGAVSLSLDPQGETSTFYADNVAYYVTQANRGYSGDLEIARIPDEMRQDIWGAVLESTSKVLYEKADAEPAVFDLGFQIEGDQQSRLIWLYGCTATRPQLGSTTIAENKEVQTETITITSAPLANGLVFACTTDETPTATVSGWFTEVYEPTI